MKARFDRTFEYGKSIARYLVISAVIAGLCALFFTQTGSYAQLTLILVSTALLVATVVVIYKYCRCPYCGKHIVAGVLRVSSCPSCRRDLSTGRKVKKSR